ncbi:MAG TPA: glycerate kinase [Acidimicrobiales bacterium]|jgi:glycerate kinase
MPLVLAAPDKFRGTASAPDVAAAIGRAGRHAGWTVDEAPMSDGGEGLLDAAGGHARSTEVQGPLGQSVNADWRMLDAPGGGTTAVIEMARAAGRELLTHPNGDEPVRADTTGVGQLINAALSAGVTRIVVGCGGSATTDGGWGAVQAIGSPDALRGVDVTIACDVTTPFRDAAAVFGPQKGATPQQVELLRRRLADLAEQYMRTFGVDVDAIAGAGAAGGLAGGLAALGAKVVPGFDLVAGLVGLRDRLAAADLVVTGEGHLDPPSFAGKVPGGVLDLARGHCPVLCVVGGADEELLSSPPDGMEIVSLVERFGQRRAREETVGLLEAVVAEALPRFCP